MSASTILVVLAALATVVALFKGIASMAEGGEYDDRHSGELMFKRVGWQAVTVLLVLLALLVE